MNVVARFAVEYWQWLDADGSLLATDLPEFARGEELVAMYRSMCLLRVFDAKAIALQRTGKLGTYASCLGHEAAHVAIGYALRPEDCFAPMYREYGVQFARGVQPRHVLMYWGGDERGSDFTGPKHDFPWCVPIATQCLHAAGAALAFKLRGEPRCALSVVGDGGTSKADFYGAINVAGARKLPYVSVIVNNQYAISVPRGLQTGAETLAQKGIAAGAWCVQVDGNDVIAVRQAVDTALARARRGEGPSVIEAVTYRLHDHTTADDARRYRREDEVKEAWAKEPIKRLRAFLEASGRWDAAREAEWQAHCQAVIDAEVNAYLELPPPPVTAMFDYLYAELPHDVKAQRQAALAEHAAPPAAGG